VRDAGVLVRDGRIAAIHSPERIPSNVDVEDVGNFVLMPGLVDTHVHVNEPGRTEWEGFETATKAAAAGGITALVDMPLNSSPVTTTLEAFKQKLAAADGKLHVDCAFYAGLIPGSLGNLEPLLDAGVLGVKAFLIHSGIDEFPNVSEEDLRAAMPAIARRKIPLLVHCELGSPVPHAGKISRYRDYLSSRPPEWESDAIRLMIGLSREYACKVHIVHVSSADSLPQLEEARSAGLPVSTETCPHYLYFAAEEIPDGDTRFKCAPPIRGRDNRDRVWNGLKKGSIDFIVSDHSPSNPALKCLESGDFQKAWGGISSLQLGLPIIWSEASKRGFTLSNIAAWMCERPAQFAGLGRKKGKIAVGYDADLIVWNPEEKFTVRGSELFHRHKVTPYEGKTLRGVVRKTFLRGEKIYEKNSFLAEPHGSVILK
jgi:allantoinase